MYLSRLLGHRAIINGRYVENYYPYPMPKKCDVLILGAGVVGLSIGKALLESNPALKVIIAEKEDTISKHASGRNSGVLHAGFFCSPDSLFI